MAIDKRPVRDFMTPLPHSIGVDQSLASATQRMWQLGVRHLPVLKDGALVGIVSERDVALIGSVASVDPERTPVEEAMTPEPYVVGPEMPFGVVARNMAVRKVGCVIVVDGAEVAGIVTTTDALALLADFLSGAALAVGAADQDVWKRLDDEHAVIRQLLRNVTELADRVLAEDSRAEPELCEQSRELYQCLLRHIDLEDVLVAPLLRRSGDASGADRLLGEHAKQREMLRSALASIESTSTKELAERISMLVRYVLEDMDHEDQLALRMNAVEEG